MNGWRKGVVLKLLRDYNIKLYDSYENRMKNAAYELLSVFK